MKISRAALLEPLEARRLLSASPHATSASAHAAPALVHAAATTTAAATAAPSLLGSWSGALNVDLLFYSKKTNFSLHVIKQTATSLKGSINIAGQVVSGQFQFQGSGRNFQITFRSTDLSGTINGSVDKAGDMMVGKIKGNGFGFPIRVSFTANKAAAT